MLKFIKRYQQDRQGKRSLPRTVKAIAELVESGSQGYNYRVYKSDKKGYYTVVNYHKLDEFDNPGIYNCPGLDSACSTLYRLMRVGFPELVKIDFSKVDLCVSKFPVKYRKAIEDAVLEFLEIEPSLPVTSETDYSDHQAYWLALCLAHKLSVSDLYSQ